LCIVSKGACSGYLGKKVRTTLLKGISDETKKLEIVSMERLLRQEKEERLEGDFK